MNTKVIFKDVKGYEGKYQVSNTGLVKNLERLVVNNKYGSMRKIPETILKPKVKTNGYLEVKLPPNKMMYIHRLVAEAFLGEIKIGHNVNHRDGVKSNNHLSNLEIVTFSENSMHAYLNKLNKPPVAPKGSEHKRAKTNESEVIKIRNEHNIHRSLKRLTTDHPSFSKGTLTKIIYRQTWRHI